MTILESTASKAALPATTCAASSFSGWASARRRRLALHRRCRRPACVAQPARVAAGHICGRPHHPPGAPHGQSRHEVHSLKNSRDGAGTSSTSRSRATSAKAASNMPPSPTHWAMSPVSSRSTTTGLASPQRHGPKWQHRPPPELRSRRLCRFEPAAGSSANATIFISTATLIPAKMPAFASLRKLYDRYSPEGRVNVTSATLQYDGERWHAERLLVKPARMFRLPTAGSRTEWSEAAARSS